MFDKKVFKKRRKREIRLFLLKLFLYCIPVIYSFNFIQGAVAVEDSESGVSLRSGKLLFSVQKFYSECAVEKKKCLLSKLRNSGKRNSRKQEEVIMNLVD